MRPKVNDSEEAKDNEILGLNRRGRGDKWKELPGIWRGTKVQKFISEVGKLFRVTHRSGRWTKEEDNRLRKLVAMCRINNFVPWTKVAYYMDKRTKDQVYQVCKPEMTFK